jgi:hypothetical protein
MLDIWLQEQVAKETAATQFLEELAKVAWSGKEVEGTDKVEKVLKEKQTDGVEAIVKKEQTGRVANEVKGVQEAPPRPIMTTSGKATVKTSSTKQIQKAAEFFTEIARRVGAAKGEASYLSKKKKVLDKAKEIVAPITKAKEKVVSVVKKKPAEPATAKATPIKEKVIDTAAKAVGAANKVKEKAVGVVKKKPAEPVATKVTPKEIPKEAPKEKSKIPLALAGTGAGATLLGGGYLAGRTNSKKKQASLRELMQKEAAKGNVRTLENWKK